MASRIEEQAAQYFEMLDSARPAALSDPLDASQYTSVAKALQIRAIHLARAILSQTASKPGDGWLLVRVAATLPIPAEDLPDDLARIRLRVLDRFVEKYSPDNSDGASLAAVERENHSIQAAVARRETLETVVQKARHAVALAARNCPSARTLLDHLLQVADEAKMLAED